MDTTTITKESLKPEAPVKDISSVEADKLAIESESTKVVALEGPSQGQVFHTLREADKTRVSNLPTENTVKAIEKNQILLEVEAMLQEGLVEYDKNGQVKGIFADLGAEVRKDLKIEGEKTASSIAQMLKTLDTDKFKLDSERVYEMIYNWLSILPGLNKAWIAQMATLKRDAILKYAVTINQE